MKVQEGYRLGSIVRRDFCPALQIDADSEQVVTSMLNQNFVPIVDGRNALCGILTRKRLIEFLAQARDKRECVSVLSPASLDGLNTDTHFLLPSLLPLIYN